MTPTPPHTHLTLGPRPKAKRAALLAPGGYVACALLDRESPKDLLSTYGKRGVHLPFTVFGLRPPPLVVVARVKRLADLLAVDKPIHVHCAAGMHRTGAVAYALLRRNGYSPASALDAILELRPATHYALTVDNPGLVGYSERYFVNA